MPSSNAREAEPRRRRRRRARAPSPCARKLRRESPCPRAAACRARSPAGRVPPRRPRGAAAASARARRSAVQSRHAVCISGETAISWRSAFCDHRRVLLLLPLLRCFASASAFRGERQQRAHASPAPSGGLRQKPSAPSTSFCGVVRLRSPCRGRARTARARTARSTSGRATSPCRASACRPSRRRSAGRRAAGPPSRRARPTRSCRSAAEPAQQAGDVDDRRLHHPRPVVERGVAEDRRDDRPHLVAALHVELLERAPRRGVGRHRDEVAPELVHEERRMVGMRDAEPARVLPRERAALAEDRLRRRRRGTSGRSGSCVRPTSALPVVAEAGQRARLLADVGLGVAAAGAEREQLHHLAPVVLVRRVLRVVAAVEPDQHRRVLRDVERAARGTSRGRAARKSSFWSSISRCEPTPSFEVANQSCQTSVIRSTSGRDVRTIRSSHQRWSWPQASYGASGCPFSSCGAARRSCSRPGRRERVDGAVEAELRELRRLAARGPKPARQSRRSAWAGPKCPR